jgi:hypothetical protein
MGSLFHHFSIFWIETTLDRNRTNPIFFFHSKKIYLVVIFGFEDDYNATEIYITEQ